MKAIKGISNKAVKVGVCLAGAIALSTLCSYASGDAHYEAVLRSMAEQDRISTANYLNKGNGSSCNTLYSYLKYGLGIAAIIGLIIGAINLQIWIIKTAMVKAIRELESNE